MYYYEVAPLQIIRANSDTFTYETDKLLAVGDFVSIPIGKKELTGLICGRVNKPSYETRSLTHLDAIPPLPEPLVNTAQWMSLYYKTHLATVLQTVLPRGIKKTRRAPSVSTSYPQRNRTHFLLNIDQARALNTLKRADRGTTILHGITGSGKTMVYIEYAKFLLEQQRSVIVLVPEIALTSQLVAEFQHHVADVIVTHSRQTESERHQLWTKVAQSTTPQVIIGPRSALFMPVRQLGAVIIDEAHEPSFKQDQAPRYSALRVAAILAEYHQGIAIQGSATPLVSEYYLANTHGSNIISLPQKARTDARDPDVTVVDMTKKSEFSRHRFLSDQLLTTMTDILANNQQVLIFHNRRGSASTTLCSECGWSAICERCFVPYTLHADAHTLRCHICDQTKRVPTSCPTCHSTDIVHKGIGTKLIESELKKLYPDKNIMRFDGDNALENTLEKRYQELYDGAIDIIIGTQVIAKGLDLPHLRAVGVIQADAGLSLPDYIASERTFQLLSQVIGRVGRSHHTTRVVVQSYQPTAPAVTMGITQSYQPFYEHTLNERQRANFPPFTYLMKLTCVYKTEAVAIRHAKQLAEKLRATYHDVTILGPTPAFYERQHDTYRWQLIIKSPKRSRLIDIIQEIPPTHWQIDLDPLSLL